ncbi:fluoride efflux transporter FluC [Chungangia koreensis]|uniref:Fluoride-specific ion channel FluC n=1 Tax=Chungangia koreensis TaxID=752657 RepID=A0ABV8X6B4_9LACT
MVIVGLGGAVGAVLRLLVTSYMDGAALWLVNGIGSLALGYMNGRLRGQSKWILFFGTGMIGSFTTFSAFSQQWFDLLAHDFIAGILYGIGMTILCFFLCWFGLNAGRKRGGQA